MKLNLKDHSKEWRKSALLAVLGLALLSSLLRWRRLLPDAEWLVILALLAALAVAAVGQPCWFRAYHLFSMRLGFAISRVLGRILLTVFFVFILTPAGWVVRRAGKDALQLKPPLNAPTFWQEAREPGPLDRLF